MSDSSSDFGSITTAQTVSEGLLPQLVSHLRSITVPAAPQACIDKFPRGNSMRRYPLGDCEGASPIDGQVGQLCG